MIMMKTCSLMTLLLIVPDYGSGFLVVNERTKNSLRPIQPGRASSISMKVNENEGDSKDLTSTKSWETFVAGSDGGQFNPFNYRKEREIQSVLGISNGNQLSLRKTQMQTLVNELLNVVGDTDETDRVLAEYQDFLLEPLEDLQAVLDPDSIYTGEMNRLERYEAYEQSMSERIRVAKNGKVRQVLECMKDFVLSHRE